MRLAAYDMTEQPVTFDCLMWLAAIGAIADDDPVHVAVLADRRRIKTEKDRALSDAEWRLRVQHVVADSMWLSPNVRAVSLIEDPEEAAWWREVETIRSGTELRTIGGLKGDIRKLRAPAGALADIRSRYDGAVVISLRINRLASWKNASLPAWLEAAGHIRSRGYRAVLIPDTEAVRSGSRLPSSYEWCVPAAMDIGYRAAVYQRAAVTMSHGIGPMAFNLFRKGAKTVQFVQHCAMDQARLARQWRKILGSPWGVQPAWLERGQRLEFAPDTAENICAAFDRIMQQ